MELSKKANQLDEEISAAIKKLELKSKEAELADLQKLPQDKDFWADNKKAQSVMKRIAKLNSQIEPWQKINKSIKESIELLGMEDKTLEADLSKQINKVEAELKRLKKDLKFSGKYDDYDVIMSVYSGAGGTDAQDWAGMLFRMYVRWAEKNKFEVKVIDESAGEEAGIKSATLEISGTYVYGRLKGEHGVHRLVRLSPFNSDNLRQTSFAMIETSPKIDEPEEVEIDDKDIKVDVYRSGGRGGQSVNTTDSAVRITHVPTNIVVAIQNERSQLQNKETAMSILRSRLAQLQVEQHADKVSELKGPNQSAEWGNQIRSYVLHPYKQVKDLRSRYETSDPDSVLDGNIDQLIDAYLEHELGANDAQKQNFAPNY